MKDVYFEQFGFQYAGSIIDSHSLLLGMCMQKREWQKDNHMWDYTVRGCTYVHDRG